MKQVVIGSTIGTTYFKRLAYWQLPYNLYHIQGKLRRGLSMVKDPTEYFIMLTQLSMIEAELIDLEYPLTDSENLLYYLYQTD